MRKWIALFEKQDLDTQILNGYSTFYDLAKDHAMDDDDVDLSEEAYRNTVHDLAHWIVNKPLYRGMRIRQLQLENANHLGIFYSADRSLAVGFSHGGDVYDERFGDQSYDSEQTGIIIELEPVSVESIDWPVTAAMYVFGGEGEIRLFENETVIIKNISDSSGRMIWNHLWGAEYKS